MMVNHLTKGPETLLERYKALPLSFAPYLLQNESLKPLWGGRGVGSKLLTPRPSMATHWIFGNELGKIPLLLLLDRKISWTHSLRIQRGGRGGKMRKPYILKTQTYLMAQTKAQLEQRCSLIRYYKANKSQITSESNGLPGEDKRGERDSFSGTGTKRKEDLKLKMEQTLRKTFWKTSPHYK